MGIEYKLGKSETGYQNLSCSKDSKAIIRNMGIYGFGDCIGFHKRTSDSSTFGSEWGLRNLGCFRELRPYERLMHMPNQAVRQLASRIYEFLYTRCGTSDFSAAPVFGNNKRKLRRIIEELTALQATEKRLAASGELIFPKPVYEQSHPSRTTVTISAVS